MSFLMNYLDRNYLCSRGCGRFNAPVGRCREVEKYPSCVRYRINDESEEQSVVYDWLVYEEDEDD